MELLSRLWSETWVGQAHVTLAVAALTLGPLIFSQPKGTRAHRWLGYGYLASMLVVNTAALTIYDLSGRPNLFHAFAVMSLGSLIPGIVCVLRGAIASHYYFMSWSYFGLLAALLSQIATQVGLFPRLGAAFGGASVFVVVLIFTALASGLTSRLINARARELLPRYAGDNARNS